MEDHFFRKFDKASFDPWSRLRGFSLVHSSLERLEGLPFDWKATFCSTRPTFLNSLSLAYLRFKYKLFVCSDFLYKLLQNHLIRSLCCCFFGNDLIFFVSSRLQGLIEPLQETRFFSVVFHRCFMS